LPLPLFIIRYLRTLIVVLEPLFRLRFHLNPVGPCFHDDDQYDASQSEADDPESCSGDDVFMDVEWVVDYSHSEMDIAGGACPINLHNEAMLTYSSRYIDDIQLDLPAVMDSPDQDENIEGEYTNVQDHTLIHNAHFD
jgi:hypothetical protein